MFKIYETLTIKIKLLKNLKTTLENLDHTKYIF